MKKKTIPVKLVFIDWNQIGNCKSIYNTELGVELSMRDLHSGTIFESELTIDEYVANEIENAMDTHEAYPLFSVIYNKDNQSNNKNDDIFENYENLLKENEELKKRIKDLEIEIAGEDW